MVAAGARDPEGLRRGGRLDLRRARHRAREGGLHAAHLLRGRPRVHAAGCRAPSIRPACCNPGKIFPSRKACGEAGRRVPSAPDRRERPRPALLSAGRARPRVVPALARQAPRRIVGAAHVLTGVELLAVRRRGPHARRRGVPRLEGRGRRRRARWPREAGMPVTPWGGGTRRRRRHAARAARPRARPQAARPAHRARAGRSHGHRRGGHHRRRAPGRRCAQRGQWLSLDPPDAERATLGGILASQCLGPAPASLRHRARPAHRRSPWSLADGVARARRRQGREERGGLRLAEALRRLVRHARRHRGGDVQAAPAPGRRTASSPRASIA